MSTYRSYPSIAAALVDFAAGRCRRHVEVDDHIIDLVQAGSPCMPSRPEYEETAEALPELADPAPPPVECCRACGRPLIGATP